MGNSTMVDPYGRTEDERNDLRNKLAAVNAEAQANWDNPVWRREMAQDMTETIYWGFQHENLLQTVHPGGERDVRRPLVREGSQGPAGVLGGPRWLHRGSPTCTPRSSRSSATRWASTSSRWKTSCAPTSGRPSRTDRPGHPAHGRRGQPAGVRGLPGGDARRTSPYYISGPVWAWPPINLALRQVRDVSYDFNVTIFGRSTMTDQIIDQIMGPGGNTAGFFPETNERLLEQGVIGRLPGRPHRHPEELPRRRGHAVLPGQRDVGGRSGRLQVRLLRWAPVEGGRAPGGVRFRFLSSISCYWRF